MQIHSGKDRPAAASVAVRDRAITGFGLTMEIGKRSAPATTMFFLYA